MSATVGLAFGLPRSVKPNYVQTDWSIALRTAAVVLGLFAVACGALILFNIDLYGLNTLSSEVGWGVLGGGVGALIVASCLQCIRSTTPPIPPTQAQNAVICKLREHKELRVVACDETQAKAIAKTLAAHPTLSEELENKEIDENDLEAFSRKVRKKLGWDITAAFFLSQKELRTLVFCAIGPSATVHCEEYEIGTVLSLSIGDKSKRHACYTKRCFGFGPLGCGRIYIQSGLSKSLAANFKAGVL